MMGFLNICGVHLVFTKSLTQLVMFAAVNSSASYIFMPVCNHASAMIDPFNVDLEGEQATFGRLFRIKILISAKMHVLFRVHQSFYCNLTFLDKFPFLSLSFLRFMVFL